MLPKMSKLFFEICVIRALQPGTVSVAMTVYEDFETYSTGVYKHVSGKSLGGHAIKMVGWGVDNGTPYWTCVNSWNDSWGEKVGGQSQRVAGMSEFAILKSH